MSLLLLIIITRLDVVEAELVNVLGRGDDARERMRTELYVLGGMHIPNPVTQGVLLEELFGEVLQVPLGQGDVGGDGDLGVA